MTVRIALAACMMMGYEHRSQRRALSQFTAEHVTAEPAFGNGAGTLLTLLRSRGLTRQESSEPWAVQALWLQSGTRAEVGSL